MFDKEEITFIFKILTVKYKIKLPAIQYRKNHSKKIGKHSFYRGVSFFVYKI